MKMESKTVTCSGNPSRRITNLREAKKKERKFLQNSKLIPQYYLFLLAISFFVSNVILISRVKQIGISDE